MKKIAINGFGRIGRTFLRTLLEDPATQDTIKVVAINIGPGQIDQATQLFKYDSIMGRFKGKIQATNEHLQINGYNIKLLSEKNPSKINWEKLDIDWVIEATGQFKTRELASLHLNAGAKKILITAPATDEDITIIPGVNDKQYDASKHNIISLGSCTTNCFAPMIKVIKENFELTAGLMTTIHAYTNDQVLLDVEHSDPRRARAAALNIIPTKTGADKVVCKIYPELNGKIKAISMRVPTPIVSLVDFSFTTKEATNKEEINSMFKKYSKNELKGILEYCEEPLVSSDFEQNPHSCIIDSLLTQSINHIHKVFGWYDNEYGYCCRLKHFLLHN